MSGGVRNLRAMFENKDQSTSPPENTRGRSPGAGSTGISSGRTSPRPLSKIRTSFVMVEKSGQVGLQMGLPKRDTSGEPSMSKRRESFRTDEQDESGITALRKESIAEEFKARKNSIMVDEIIPETAVETPSSGTDKQLGAGKQDDSTASNGNGDTKKTVASTSSATKTVAAKGGSNGISKPATPSKSTDKPTTLKTISRPAAISTAKTSLAPKASPRAVKTPVPKTPTTPGHSRTKDASSKAADNKAADSKAADTKAADNKAAKKPTAPTQTSKPTTQPSTTQPSTTARTSAPKTRIPPSPPQTGFVKPRPRSPTRPVKLPASLTAHTASSGSKLANAPPTTSRQSLSRASGTFPGTSQSRSPSRTSKSSGRTSFGPPPAALKKQPSRQNLPSQNAAAPDSFLARMMRPTTSSAAKTSDKPEAPQPASKVQPVKKPAAKESAPKPRAVPASSAVPKTSKPTAVTKPVAKETKHTVVPPRKDGPRLAAKFTAVQAPKEMAKHEPEKPAPELEKAAPETPPKPSAIAAETVNVPEPTTEGLEELEAAEPEAPEAEPAKSVEAPVPSEEHEAATAQEEILEEIPAEEEEAVVEASSEAPEETVQSGELEPVEVAEVLQPVEVEHVEDVESAEPAEPVEPVKPVEEVEEVVAIPVVAEAEDIKDAAMPEEAEHTKPEPGSTKEAEDINPGTAPVSEPEQAKPEEPEIETAPAPPSVEELVEPTLKPELVKPEVVEDPEDVKAREEVARLNAQFLSASAQHHDAVGDDEVD